jgi:WG containing repeat
MFQISNVLCINLHTIMITNLYGKGSLLFILITSITSLLMLPTLKFKSDQLSIGSKIVKSDHQEQSTKSSKTFARNPSEQNLTSFGRLQEKRGFMSSNGKVIIAPQYKDIVSEFSDGLAIVDIVYTKAPKYFKADFHLNPFGTSQLIDTNGKVVLQSKENERFLCQSEGYAVKEVISETYKMRAAAKKTSNSAVIDKNQPYEENILRNEEDEKYLSQKLVNIKTGKELPLSSEIKYVSCFRNGLASAGVGMVNLGSGLFMGERNGYIGKDGKFVIRPKFTSAENFQSNGFALVAVGKETFFIDRKEQMVSDGKGKTVFNEGLAILYTENGEQTSTVIDRTGKVVFKLPPSLDFLKLSPSEGFTTFSSGLIPVKDKKREKYGYVDRTGKIVIPIQLQFANPFSNGVGRVNMSDYKSALVNVKGKIIWKE